MSETQKYFNEQTNDNETLLEKIRDNIQNSDAEQILTYITHLEEQWCLNCQGDRMVPLTNGFKRYYSEDQLDASGLPVELDIECVCEKHRRTQTFHYLHTTRQMIYTITHDDITVYNKSTQIRDYILWENRVIY